MNGNPAPITDGTTAQTAPTSTGAARKPTVREVLRAATGYDEIAVEQQWGVELGDVSGTKMGRVCAFLLARARGLSDVDAKREAMTLTLGQIDDMLADEDEGKGEPNGEALAAAAAGDVDRYIAAQAASPEA